MTIRRVSETDIDQWAMLRNTLWPDSIDLHKKELSEFFAGVSTDIVEAFVAIESGEVIGFIELNIRNFAEGSREPAVPYVEAWCISPSYQDKGYGKQLIKTAEDWAKSNGYNELASDTELVNDKSINIHKHLGFRETERVVCFIKPLS